VVPCPLSRRTWLRAAATLGLASILLIISTLLIILGSFRAEDFQEGIDPQHIIDQSGFSTDP
jgi:hypothetical protein